MGEVSRLKTKLNIGRKQKGEETGCQTRITNLADKLNFQHPQRVFCMLHPDLLGPQRRMASLAHLPIHRILILLSSLCLWCTFEPTQSETRTQHMA